MAQEENNVSRYKKVYKFNLCDANFKKKKPKNVAPITKNEDQSHTRIE